MTTNPIPTHHLPEESVAETADRIEPEAAESQDPVHPELSALPPVRPPTKLPVPGVPTEGEVGLVDSEHTSFKGRSKYRAWA